MRRAKDKQLGGTTQYYATPHWATHRLLDAIDLPRGGHWVELGFGAGAIVRAVASYEQGGERPYQGCHWSLFEIDPVIARVGVARINQSLPELRSFEVVMGDVLTGADIVRVRAGGLADVAIFNPPNDLAGEFIVEALKVANVACCFQPLQIYAGEEREQLFSAHRPSRVLVLPNRPRFRGQGSPMQTYAWFIFDRRRPTETRLDRLALTNLSVRKADFARQSAEDLEDFGPPDTGHAHGVHQ